MAERAAIKIARAAIRLKYSVAAEAEINEGLPAVQAAVRKAVAEGRPWQLDVQAIFLGEGDAVIDPDAIEASSE
jgi:hypothetical protein